MDGAHAARLVAELGEARRAAREQRQQFLPGFSEQVDHGGGAGGGIVEQGEGVGHVLDHGFGRANLARGVEHADAKALERLDRGAFARGRVAEGFAKLGKPRFELLDARTRLQSRVLVDLQGVGRDPELLGELAQVPAGVERAFDQRRDPPDPQADAEDAGDLADRGELPLHLAEMAVHPRRRRRERAGGGVEPGHELGRVKIKIDAELSDGRHLSFRRLRRRSLWGARGFARALGFNV